MANGNGSTALASTVAQLGSAIEDVAARVDRMDAVVQRQDELIARFQVDLAQIRDTLGTAPDPIQGLPGTGAVGMVYRLGNHLLTGGSRSPMETLLGEGPDTERLSRKDLIELHQRSQRKMKIAIIGVVTTLITTLGTIAITWIGATP